MRFVVSRLQVVVCLEVVPQGSVLGHCWLSYRPYVVDDGDISGRHALSSQLYADDVHLDLTCRRSDSAACGRVSACIDEIDNLMAG